MRITVNLDDVREVLVAGTGGWVFVASVDDDPQGRSTFNVNSPRFQGQLDDADGVHVAGDWFEFLDYERHLVVGPLTSIMALKTY
jgi:hypothetical protein